MINYPQVHAGPQAFKTYRVFAPPSHYRRATCAEVDCDGYLHGWTALVEVNDGATLHAYRTSGRPHTETTDGLVVTFDFEAGVGCRTPSQHRVQVLPEIYVVRGGDWRGNPTGMRRQHRRPEHWVEDFGEHQQALLDEMKRG